MSHSQTDFEWWTLAWNWTCYNRTIRAPISSEWRWKENFLIKSNSTFDLQMWTQEHRIKKKSGSHSHKHARARTHNHIEALIETRFSKNKPTWNKHAVFNGPSNMRFTLAHFWFGFIWFHLVESLVRYCVLWKSVRANK